MTVCKSGNTLYSSLFPRIESVSSKLASDSSLSDVSGLNLSSLNCSRRGSWERVVVSRSVSIISTRLVRGCSGGLLCLLLVLAAGDGIAWADSTDSQTRTTIWDREIPGTNRSYADVSRGDSIERVAEPAQLPLPAPVLAAGLGLVGAYLVKKRLGRS